MHITGEEAAVINVGVGAILGWGGGAWNQWRTGRRAAKDARGQRRRDSYTNFILAVSHFERLWNAAETLEPDQQAKTAGELSGTAIREIESAHVAIMLSGSKEAKEKAQAARNAAWDVNDTVRGRKISGPQGLITSLADRIEIFTVAGR